MKLLAGVISLWQLTYKSQWIRDEEQRHLALGSEGTEVYNVHNNKDIILHTCDYGFGRTYVYACFSDNLSHFQCL